MGFHRMPIFILFLFEVLQGTYAQELSNLEVRDLTGATLQLPSALAGKAAVLVVGFSRKSGDQTARWVKRLAEDATVSSAVAIYSVAILQEVPGLFRGLVVNGIRNETPRSFWSYSFVAFSKEAVWKSLVGFERPDDAYLLLIDTQGRELWRGHGEVTSLLYDELSSNVAEIGVPQSTHPDF